MNTPARPVAAPQANARRSCGVALRAGALCRTWMALLLLLLGGCASSILSSSQAPGEVPLVEQPHFQPPPRAVAPRVALVLSGGSLRAFAHLGVLRVLEREGLRPGLVVGSSAGALIGAYYAAGLSVAQIEAQAMRLNLATLIDIDPVKIVLGGLGLGVAKGQRLEAFLRATLDLPLQSLPLLFAAVATDLNSGETVLLNQGDTPRALRASAAMPGLYEPVVAGARLLADGQITSPLPVAGARALGAQVVVAVDVVYPPQHAALSNPVSVLLQTLTISTYRHLVGEREQADLVIRPQIAAGRELSLRDPQWLIAAGEAAALAQLPALRAAFARR